MISLPFRMLDMQLSMSIHCHNAYASENTITYDAEKYHVLKSYSENEITSIRSNVAAKSIVTISNLENGMGIDGYAKSNQTKGVTLGILIYFKPEVIN